MICDVCGKVLDGRGSAKHVNMHENGRGMISMIDENTIRKMYLQEGLSTWDIAEKLNTDQHSVRSKLSELGMLKTRSEASVYRWEKIRGAINTEQIKKMYLDDKLSITDISCKLGISTSTVHSRLIDMEVVRSRSEAQKGKIHSEESKSSSSVKMKIKWKDENYRKKSIRTILRSTPNYAKNSEEKELEIILNDILPGKFLYNGDGRLDIFPGGHATDFICVDDRKLIEYNGCYYHNCKICGYGNNFSKRDFTDMQRLEDYRINNWDCLVIWGHEMKNLEELKLKIMIFYKEGKKELAERGKKI